MAITKEPERVLFEALEPRLLLSAMPVSGDLLSAASDAAVDSLGGIFLGGLPDKLKPGKSSGPNDIGGTFADAAGISLNDLGCASVSSKIDYAADVDMFSFLSSVTGRMQIDFDPLMNKKNKVSADLSVYYDGGEIARDADGTDVGASISLGVVGGRTYYIRAASLNGEVGRYTLEIVTVESLPPPPDPEPEPGPAPEPEPEPGPAPEPDPLPGDYVPGEQVAWFVEGEMSLVVLGTDADDAITLSRSSGSTVIITAAGTYTLAATFDSVQLYGFGGDDLLVTISGAAEEVWGGLGFDSFWADSLDFIGDADLLETAAGAVHIVSEFYQPTEDPAEYVSLEIAGQDIVDPAANYAYKDFSDSPLFVDGPEYDDVIQGGVNDCYFLAALSSMAQSDPGIIEQMIAPMGDGTYAVRFHRGGQEVYLRVDAQLPAQYYWPSYAHWTPDGEIWVALAEKAYAQFRTGENSYASIAYGWMDPVYAEITGQDALRTYTSGMSNDSLAEYISENLEAGHATSAGTYSSASDPIQRNHAYTIESIENVGGQWYVTVYNVWGSDAATWDSNNSDGLLTISMDLFQENFSAISVSVA